MLDRHEYEKGSFTVEASMIFSLIVLVIVLLVFTFSYMQQKIYLTAAASFAAQQGAELWLDSRRDMNTGRINTAMEEDPFGYRLLDDLLLNQKTCEGYIEKAKPTGTELRFTLVSGAGRGMAERKAELIGKALCYRLEGASMHPESTRVKISYSNKLLRKRLSVEIIQEIKVPIGGIKKLIDGKETVTLLCHSEAAVSEPEEYIRNIDLAVELSKKLGDRLDIEGIIDKLKGKEQK